MGKKIKFYIDGAIEEAEICGTAKDMSNDQLEKCHAMYVAGGRFESSKCYLLSELKELYEIETFDNDIAKKYYDFIIIDEECII